MFALALIKGHGGSCALIHLHAIMLKIHTYYVCVCVCFFRKGGGGIQEADLQLAVPYLNNTNSPGSHCELAPFSACPNGWILPKPVTHSKLAGGGSLFSTRCEAEATH